MGEPNRAQLSAETELSLERPRRLEFVDDSTAEENYYTESSSELQGGPALVFEKLLICESTQGKSH